MAFRSFLLRSLFGLFALVAAAACTFAEAAEPFESRARNAFLVDVDSGTILYRKAEELPFEPAAMVKMMTMAVVFDAIRAGKIHLDDQMKVSEHAWRTGGAPSGGATMFAAIHSSIPVSDLLRGAIVQAGNDACLILAEGLAGSEAVFVDMMNQKAKQIGLTGSVFRNVTGFQDPEQVVTAHDMARLAEHLIREYPDLYKIYAEPEFTWNRILQRNRNPLLADNLGADGLSTGFTPESGYGLTASAVRDGRRMILVVAGLTSDKERAEEARRLLDWGTTAFERLRFFDAGEAITQARVFGGASSTVGLATKDPLELLLLRGSRDRIRARVVYNGPLVAPVKQGTEAGVVRVWVGEDLAVERPVYTVAAVGAGTMTQRAIDAVQELLLGWL